MFVPVALPVWLSADSPIPVPLQIASSVAGTIATVVGIAIAVRAAREKPIDSTKDALEKRKLALEVRREEISQGLEPGDQQVLLVAAVRAEASAIDGQIALNLVLRFVFLYLVLRAWAVVGTLFQAGAGTLGFLRLVAFLPDAIATVFFVSLGWPLLLDVAKLLGIELPKYLRGQAARATLLTVGVLSAVFPTAVLPLGRIFG